MDLEDDPYCNTDYVEIRKRDHSHPVEARLCGNEMPRNITMYETTWVKFRSNEDNQFAGFEARYDICEFNLILL